MIIKIKSLQKENLRTIMNKIKRNEGIEMDPQAEEFILTISNNNAKILINYMEKFKLLNMFISYDIVLNVCTNISFLSFQKYTKYIKDNNVKEAIQIIYSIYDKGYSVMDILDNYFVFIKITDLLSEDEKYKIIPYICKYIAVFHTVHEDEIELILFTNNLIEQMASTTTTTTISTTANII
jgi:DNA polymerase III delta prime subunit